MNAAVMTLARYYAKQAIKAEWHKQGLRWQYMDGSQLTHEAKVYLNKHHELIDRARAQLLTDAPKRKA
jgi:hypothetical protein